MKSICLPASGTVAGSAGSLEQIGFHAVFLDLWGFVMAVKFACIARFPT